MYRASRFPIFLSFLIGPMLVIVLAVVAYPFFYNIVLSFSNANLYTIRDWRIVGIRQYVAVFSEPILWELLIKTLVWTVVNVFFHVTIGVALAVALHQKFIRGKPWWRMILILPWALPQYITALTWRGMFNYDYGAINVILREYLRLPPVQWLGSPLEAFVAVIITNIWMGFPFMMVVALGGLQSIPNDLYEAAEIDGASAWQQFCNITLPLLRPVLAPAITLGTVWTFNNINVVWLVSNMGEPAESTHILVSYVYKAAFSMYRLGWAAALSMVIFMILVLITQSYMRHVKASEPVY
ncbi:MAG: sugar ABC transporter permease [Methylacidiphilales bacterium]|nr:sugar ABC transporter permease [Candidatus Methylacidiphilales bacterium]MDW8349241.1 sugar ABC transporter permease [Verrucomicrobiae bacterium]